MSTTTTALHPLHDLVCRCRQQQETWARQPVRERLRPVRSFRRLLVAEMDALLAAVSRDIGKSAEETLAGDLLPLADACRFLEQEACRLLQPRYVPARHRPLWLWGQSDSVHHRPHGVVGIIGTWNFPLFLNGVQLVQALTAGNGVLWKPSETAPASAQILFDLLRRAGFPEGLVHLLEATREAGQELAEADVDHIVFTGSETTGRRLAGRLGERLVSSTLELSGCDAMFVLDDADVDLAARAAWFGITLNRGQTCLAVRRVFVQRSRYAALAGALKSLAASARPLPMVLSAQVQQAERLIQEALEGGAQLLHDRSGRVQPAGGSTDQHFPPTIVLDARPDMSICSEPSFAPLLGVLPFDTIEEALQMDAVCRNGLGASIFTQHPERAASLAARLKVGAVTVNDVIVPTAHPATPFGGRGDSGWGVTQGAEGLLAMTVPQVVSVRGGRFRPHYDPPEQSRWDQREVLRGFLQWSHAAGWRERWHGLVRMIRGLWSPKERRSNVMPPSVFERLHDWLQQNGASFTVLRHEPVFTSEQAAAVRGTPLSSGAKALIIKAGERFVLLVLPADRKLDNRKARAGLGIKSLRFATKEEVAELTGLQPGAIPPFGSFFGLPTYCDPALAENPSINFNAGDHAISVQMTCADYLHVETPTLVGLT